MSRLTPLAAQAAITEVHQRSAEKIQTLTDCGKIDTLRDFVLRIETNPCETVPESKKCDENTYRLGYTGLHAVLAEDATTIGFRDQNGEIHAITMPRDTAGKPIYSSWSIETRQDDEVQDDDILPAPSYFGIVEIQECSDLVGTDKQKTIATAIGHMCSAIEMADAIPRPRAPIMELDPHSFTIECLRRAGSLHIDSPQLSAANPQESFNPTPQQDKDIPDLDQTRVLVTI